MVNFFADRQFSLCYEKNSFQFSYFFNSSYILKEVCQDLFLSLGFWVKFIEVNYNFYVTSVYLEIYPIKSILFSDFHVTLFKCLEDAFCSSLLNGCNIKIFYLIYPNFSQQKNSYFAYSTQVIQITSVHGGATFLASVFASTLIANSQHQRSIDFFIREFEITFNSSKSCLVGAKFKISGRINGVDRSRCITKRFGSFSLNSVSTRTDYGFFEAFTPSGTCSIHVWFAFNKYL